jgi:ParB/RepB/Spo0J family partition protein
MKPGKKRIDQAKLAARVAKMVAEKKGDRVIAETLNITRHLARVLMQAAQRPKDGTTRLPIEAIVVGDRVRKDFGDVTSLAKSINANGLLHPIVVRRHTGYVEPHYELIAGERRLRAWGLSQFRDDPIPVNIVDLESVKRGEWAENHERKNFTPSETVEIKRALEREFDLSGAAERRMRAGRKAPAGEKGRAVDLAAAYTGVSGKTIRKAEAVVKAAEEDPERFGQLKTQMDKSGRVDGPHKRLQNITAGERLKAEPPPLPMNGPYRTIAMDWPWPADLDGFPAAPTSGVRDAAVKKSRDNDVRGYYPYKTMSMAELAAFDIASLIHPDGCTLLFWIPNFHLARGCHLEFLARHGFTASTILTWCKPKIGQGQRLRGATEHCILAVRGKVPVLGADTRTWFEAPPASRDHSAKPALFFDIVEKVAPAPRYAYLFAGAVTREGWDMHGDRPGQAGTKPASREAFFEAEADKHGIPKRPTPPIVQDNSISKTISLPRAAE